MTEATSVPASPEETAVAGQGDRESERRGLLDALAVEFSHETCGAVRTLEELCENLERWGGKAAEEARTLVEGCRRDLLSVLLTIDDCVRLIGHFCVTPQGPAETAA